MNLTNELTRYQSQLNDLIEEANRRLLHAPNGNLRCSTSNNTTQYYIDSKYASISEIDRITQLAQRDYDKDFVKVAGQTISCLSKLISRLTNTPLTDIYTKLCQGRKCIVTPSIPDPIEYINQWASEVYPPGVFDENDTTEYYSAKNERMRSKTEVIIANELYRYGIPYKYERPIELQDGYKKVIFRPDFSTLNIRTLRPFILEHLGMMNKTNYCNRALHKLDVYEHNNYLIGVNLILLHETDEDSISTKVIDRYIETYLL